MVKKEQIDETIKRKEAEEPFELKANQKCLCCDVVMRGIRSTSLYGLVRFVVLCCLLFIIQGRGLDLTRHHQMIATQRHRVCAAFVISVLIITTFFLIDALKTSFTQQLSKLNECIEWIFSLFGTLEVLNGQMLLYDREL